MSVEGVVGSESVELVGEGVDPSVDVIEVVVGQVPCGLELVSPCAVVAFDVSVEFGGSGREFEEVDAAFPAFAFEVGFELGAAVDLDGVYGEGHVVEELVEEAFGVVGGCAAPGLCACPLGDGVACGELLDSGAPVSGVDGHGVELDDLAGCCGFASLGQSPGVGAVAARGALRRGVAAGGTRRPFR